MRLRCLLAVCLGLAAAYTAPEPLSLDQPMADVLPSPQPSPSPGAPAATVSSEQAQPHGVTTIETRLSVDGGIDDFTDGAPVHTQLRTYFAIHAGVMPTSVALAASSSIPDQSDSVASADVGSSVDLNFIILAANHVTARSIQENIEANLATPDRATAALSLRVNAAPDISLTAGVSEQATAMGLSSDTSVDVAVPPPPSPPPLPPPLPLDESPFACFSGESSRACLAPEAITDANAAYDACFREKGDAVAMLVHMRHLRAGDRVLSLDKRNGSPTLERIVVNQHAESREWATLLQLTTENGAVITVTPDHVLAINGKFAPAADAAVGMQLSAGRVVSITKTMGTIINPITPSGTILATDDAASHTEPVYAATHPDWIAAEFLDAPLFPLLATRFLSFLAPATFQSYYAAFEKTFSAATPAMKYVCDATPSAMLVGMVIADATLALGFVAYSAAAITAPLGVAGLAMYFTASRKSLASA